MLVLENGSGVQGANSAINSDFVTSYLTTLNRQDQNGWNADTTTDAIKQAACIAATQYVEKRWGDRFIGEKLYFWEEVKATAEITIDSIATDNSMPGSQYIIIAGERIEFSSGATDIGTAIMNLLPSLTAKKINAELKSQGSNTIVITSKSYGVMGNYDAEILQESDSDLADDEKIVLNITQWAGGLHGGEQQTSYPREDWSEPMPLIYLNALAEYAIRSLADGLIPDPEVDPSGRVVIEKKERVGAIEEQTKYAVGTSLTQQFKPYPEADILLRPLLRGGQGRVYR